jgi:ADP-ribosylation factor GTPase-activating protein 2/3
LCSINCAGDHRGLGVNKTFVRSTDLDTWSEAQLLTMELGGNRKAAEFFSAHGWVNPGGKYCLNDKYSSQAAILYKAHMHEVVNNYVVSKPANKSLYVQRYVF